MSQLQNSFPGHYYLIFGEGWRECGETVARPWRQRRRGLVGRCSLCVITWKVARHFGALIDPRLVSGLFSFLFQSLEISLMGRCLWEAISVESSMSSRLVIQKLIAMVEFIDW